MNNTTNYSIFVEKLPRFRVEAESLRRELNTKLNLSLDVLGTRPDGFHDLRMIMQSVDLHDDVTVTLDGTGVCRAETNRSYLPCGADNVAVRAAQVFLGRAGLDCGVHIRLHKRIPVCAGLGGGSSDAAAALVGLAQLWGLPADDPRIEEVARTLGADVPFFLHGGCAVLDGAGDALVRELAPMGSPVVLVKPAGGVSTAAAYRAFDERPVPVDSRDRDAALAAASAQDVPLCNNLAAASESLLPALADVRAWAEACPEVRQALMSGSGSAVFMQCATFADAGRVAAEARMRGWWARATMFGSARAAVVPNR